MAFLQIGFNLRAYTLIIFGFSIIHTFRIVIFNLLAFLKSRDAFFSTDMSEMLLVGYK